jgi:hypothetical protein
LHSLETKIVAPIRGRLGSLGIAAPEGGAAFQGEVFMKFAAQTLAALATAGLLMGAMGSAPTLAGTKAEAPKTIFDYIEADLKAIDKAIFGTPKKK